MNSQLTQAIMYRQAGQTDQALQLLETLYQQQPDDASLNYQIACCHDSAGDETQAVPYYERAIALGLAPDELRGALLGLGSTYRTIGEYSKAVATLKQGAETFPDAREFPVFLGMALYNTGANKEAVSLLLNLLLDVTHNTDILHFQRAIALYAQDLDQVWC